MRYSQNISMLLLLTLLVSCSGTAPRDLKPWEANQDVASSRASSSGAKSVKPEYGPKLSVGEPYTVKRGDTLYACLLYTSPSPRDLSTSRMPSSA